jgi:phospholipid transport system transporter-binding protein
MTAVVEITQNNGRWLVSGNLLLDDVELLLAQNIVVDGSKTLEVDLSGVADVDSVAISLLFEWVRQARANQCILTFSNLPANLVSLASLYGVLDFLPLAADPAASH